MIQEPRISRTYHRIYQGDALTVLRTLPSDHIQCVVTSPPYWGLRDYGVAGQIGLERTPEEYVSSLTAVFHEVRRVLRPDGTLWLNLGDSYACGMTGSLGTKTTLEGGQDNQAASLSRPSKLVAGLKPKDLVGIPWSVAFALRADGWYLRSDIIWHKPNPMPESIRDRPTKAHEYLFLLSKSPRYFYDHEAVKEPANPKNYRASPCMRDVPPGQTRQGKLDSRRGEVLCMSRNLRDVWTIATHPFKGAHFATFPMALVEPCVKAGSRLGDIVMDPFAGSGTVGLVAKNLGREFIGIELNPDYVEMATKRIS